MFEDERLTSMDAILAGNSNQEKDDSPRGIVSAPTERLGRMENLQPSEFVGTVKERWDKAMKEMRRILKLPDEEFMAAMEKVREEDEAYYARLVPEQAARERALELEQKKKIEEAAKVLREAVATQVQSGSTPFDVLSGDATSSDDSGPRTDPEIIKKRLDQGRVNKYKTTIKGKFTKLKPPYPDMIDRLGVDDVDLLEELSEMQSQKDFEKLLSGKMRNAA